MYRRTPLIVGLLILAVFLSGSTLTQTSVGNLVLSGGTALPGIGVTQWCSPHVSAQANATVCGGAQTLANQFTVGFRGTALSIAAFTDAAPGAAISFTLVWNGLDTAITCSIPAGGNSCGDTTHPFLILENQPLRVKVVTGNPQNAAVMAWKVVLGPPNQ